MAFLKNIIRGGQTHLHDLRMMMQILKVAFWVKSSLLIVIFLSLVGFFMDHQSLTFYKDYRLASISALFKEEKRQAIAIRGKIITLPLKTILTHPGIQTEKNKIEAQLLVYLLGTFLSALLLTSFILVFWFKYGQKNTGKAHKRGAQLVPCGELIKQIKKDGEASKVKIDDLPLLKSFESRHFLITGTTGVGKTNCLNGLIAQLNALKHPKLIVDINGSYVQKFYHPESDILLNPFDERSSNWNIWEDLSDEAFITEFASSLIPDAKGGSDPFWNNAARTVLIETMLKFKTTGNHSIQTLYHLLAEADLKDFVAYLSGTAASNIIDPSADRMAVSIRATLITYIKFFKYLKEDEAGFSFRAWFQNIQSPSNQSIYLSCSQKYRDLLKPLISAWFNLSINCIMALDPNDQRRIWLIMDEMAALQKLNHLSMGLAELRKYGGCIIACLQNKAQLEEIYGALALKNMLDNFNTKFFFRSSCPDIARWISEVLGKAETIEKIENISYGSHAMRDGVSIATQTKLNPIFMPEEIMELEDLEIIVKYPAKYPITKFKCKYNAFEEVQEAFMDNHKLNSDQPSQRLQAIPNSEERLLTSELPRSEPVQELAQRMGR